MIVTTVQQLINWRMNTLADALHLSTSKIMLCDEYSQRAWDEHVFCFTQLRRQGALLWPGQGPWAVSDMWRQA
jgi:hypothetical protein